MKNAIELNKANGKLNVCCANCKTELKSTTAKVKELMETGEPGIVDSLCFLCSSRVKAQLQFGSKEYGRI